MTLGAIPPEAWSDPGASDGWPRLAKVRQSFPRPVLQELEREVHATIRARLALRPGSRVAIAVGSRGIANQELIVRSTVAAIRALGGEPFVVPAMGSHGGGTAEGQLEVLQGYGIAPERVGCPVRSSMEVVEVPDAGGDGYRVYMDRLAFESDGVVLVNRIKPHTDFLGRYESGLLKMAVIGLGKVAQAEEIHRHGVRGLTHLLPEAGAQLVGSGRILLGLGVVENAYHETMLVEAVEPGRILAREPELLELARANMPRLPVDALDVLVVDRMGKDVSGAGMDTNVIGRIGIRGQPDRARPRIGMIAVTDLTDASHGNAAGMGLADVATRRLLEKIDFPATYANVAASGFLDRGRLPMVAESDAQALAWALRGCGAIAPGRERVVRIRDTLSLDEMYVSRAVYEELAEHGPVDVLALPAPACDGQGTLSAF